MGRCGSGRGGRFGCDRVTAAENDCSGGDGFGPIKFVTREHHGRPAPHYVAQKPIEKVSALGVKPGVGLIEQPQLGAPRQNRGQGGATALARRQRCDRLGAQPAVETQPGQRFGNRSTVESCGPNREANVFFDSEVFVEKAGVTEQPDAAPERAQNRRTGRQRRLEDAGEAVGDRHEAGTGSQNCRLAGAVRPSQKHDFASVDTQVDARERRESAKKGNDAFEGNDRGAHALTEVSS